MTNTQQTFSEKPEQPVNIDLLFADTWLMVCQLRNGTVVTQGRELYRKACALVDQARKQLQEAGVSSASIEHMLYAQCALLDASVMNRQEQDDAYREWLKSPLQTQYFNTLEAGEQLWDKIRGVLNEPTPDIAVLTCFHRVLQLGFNGRYGAQDPARRDEVRDRLAQRVPPFSLLQDLPLVLPAGRSRRGRQRVWLWWLGGIALLGAMWWGLDASLQQYLQQILPKG
ncbi:type VI secretion system protein TssL, short form [Serratia aquatilis]|uniref:Type VI secretion system protein TssL, short form n=1 Tax=Serratia aquatilis TaxID=1737515 RepID=A0ABV6EJF9_9GAMM